MEYGKNIRSMLQIVTKSTIFHLYNTIKIQLDPSEFYFYVYFNVHLVKFEDWFDQISIY
jgi:hypothetical protein